MIRVRFWQLVALVALLVLVGMAGACILFGYDYDGWWALTTLVFFLAGARLVWLELLGDLA